MKLYKTQVLSFFCWVEGCQVHSSLFSQFSFVGWIETCYSDLLHQLCKILISVLWHRPCWLCCRTHVVALVVVVVHLGNVVRVTLDCTGSYILSQWIITKMLVWCTSDEVFIVKFLMLLHQHNSCCCCCFCCCWIGVVLEYFGLESHWITWNHIVEQCLL